MWVVSDCYSCEMLWNWLWQTRVSRGQRISWPAMYLVAQWVQLTTCCREKSLLEKSVNHSIGYLWHSVTLIWLFEYCSFSIWLHCALASCGAVYCNRSCLWVCDSGRTGGVRGLLQPACVQCLHLSEHFFHLPCSCVRRMTVVQKSINTQSFIDHIF